jgi:steroid delta-isomerase-like uncharacterized protein
MDWGEQYEAAWNAHDVEALVALCAPDCRYTDVAFRMTWEGHDGIRQMFQATVEFHPDVEVIRHSGFRDGRNYVWEWTMSGTVAGQWVSYRGISAGTLDEQDRVVEQRDYWNPKDIPSLGPD